MDYRMGFERDLELLELDNGDLIMMEMERLLASAERRRQEAIAQAGHEDHLEVERATREVNYRRSLVEDLRLGFSRQALVANAYRFWRIEAVLANNERERAAINEKYSGWRKQPAYV